MKNKIAFTTILLIVFLLTGNLLLAQIPVGGTMMNVTTGTTYQKIGKGTITEVAVTDQPFTKALRLATGTDVSSPWDTQVKFPAATGITAKDVVLVAFYARTISSVQETGESFLTVSIENNKTYAKELYHKIPIGSQWKQYYVSVKCVSTLATSELSYAFHAGYASQTLEIADVKYLNYKNTLTIADLPVTEITYLGQDPKAEWRALAEERINQIRKGSVAIQVNDQNGNAVKDASVTIEMVRHQFGFGSAIPASLFLSNAVFRNKVYELFNEVVFENDLKWPQLNPTSKLNVKRSLDSLDHHKIAVRGHNVIWPAFKWCPPSLQSLSTNPIALDDEINKHIDEVTQFTKGRLNDWDVINEPYTEHEIMDILGKNVMVDWLKRVKENDGDVKLYINDYAILSGGGLNTKKQDYYYDLIKYLDEQGAQVDGIGFQGHFSNELTPITKVYSILERFATLGKEIKITEHDIAISQRAVQAEYTRDFMTILFSHASVKSMLVWGFWENSHWKPDAAFFNADWTIRPHGEAWKDLVFNRWWTKKTARITDTQGKITFEGFLGTYKYTIKSAGKESSGTFTIDHSTQSGLSNSVVLSMDNLILDREEFNLNNNNFKVYPNPFQGSFLLETNCIDNEPINVELFNVMGKRMFANDIKPIMGKLTIPVSVPGVYTLRVSHKSGVEVFKLIGK